MDEFRERVKIYATDALQLKGTSRRVARSLEITGLDRLFDIVPPDSQP